MRDQRDLSEIQYDEAVAEKVFAAEKNISGVRAAVILLNTLVYVFLMDKQDTIPWLAHTIIVVAITYAFYVLLFQPYRKFPLFLASYFTYITDGILITLWLLATGGYDSPFHVLWYISILAVGFRFSPRVIIFTAFLYAALYLGLLAYTDEISGHTAKIVVRIGYIFLTAYLGILISGEMLAQTRQKKKMQLLAQEAKEAEEKLKVQTHLYETMLNAQSELGEGVSITEGARIVYANEALCKIYGYTEQELIAFPSFLDLIVPEERESLAERLRQRLSGTEMAYKGQTIVKHKDGHHVHIAYSLKMITNEGKQQLFSIIRDITEEVRSREALEKSTLDLARSKELEQKKDEFIGVASHELKTPLTSLKGYIQLVQRTLDSGTDHEAAKIYTSKTHMHVERLTSLINDLLDVSRVQAGKLEFYLTDFDLHEMLQETVESMQHVSQTHKIVIENNIPQILKGDRTRLEQVLTNLITNAVKYSPKSDTVTVSAHKNEKEVIIAVKDSGMGIPKEHSERIFERFFRVESSGATMKIPGLGIGLYISAEIVKRHNGKIWVESEEGKGSTFYISLPI